MNREEFIDRFKDELKRWIGPAAYSDNESYIDEIAPTYWDDPEQRADGPEECAESEALEWTSE